MLTAKYHEEIAAILRYKHGRGRLNEEKIRYLIFDFRDYLYRDNTYFNFKNFKVACWMYNINGKLAMQQLKKSKA